MHKRILFLTIISLLYFSACSSPAPTATVTAQPTEVPPTPTVTPTPAPPMVRVENEANCSSSPGEGGSAVAVIPAGETVRVIGKDSTGEYWVVIDPTSEAGCWIRREGTTAQGVTDFLPNLVPPTPLPLPPPENMRATLQSCTRVYITLGWRWTEKKWRILILVDWEYDSDLVDGFTLFRGEKELSTFGPDQTEYWDNIMLDKGNSDQVSYSLVAWSEGVESSQPATSELKFVCQ